MSRTRTLRVLIICLVCFAFLATLTVARSIQGHAQGSNASGLSVYVGYAEIKGSNIPDPATFPFPWQGSPNVTFLGGRVTGQTACGTYPLCFDTGAIRLDNTTTSNIQVSSVSVNVHADLPNGHIFNLWGSFTVPAGQSVILAENPPNNNPNHDNFDTSNTLKGNCTPNPVAPSVTITVNSVANTLYDSTHVLDTGGIDPDSCNIHNESTQWRPIGSAGTNRASITLAPALSTLPVGQQVTETATFADGGGVPYANIPVTFTVTSGPDAGQTGSGVTDQNGHATFNFTNTGPGTDLVVASTTNIIGPMLSSQAAVLWSNNPSQVWSGQDIGAPTLAGSDSESNGVWTIAGSGSDVGGTADQFHYVSQLLATDGGISAHVLSQTNTNSAAQAGVMMRQGSSAGAVFYAILVTPLKGIMVLDRATQGVNVHTVATIAGAAPAYVKVQRSGTTFSAYTSSDGVTWTLVPGSTTTLTTLVGTVFAGMAVSSHTTLKISTATFDTVTIP
jgi:hypothetical protein